MRTAHTVRVSLALYQIEEPMFSELEITGRSRTHVVQISEPRFAAHPDAAEAFLQMKGAASKDGFDLVPFSTFRDYKTQLLSLIHI